MYDLIIRTRKLNKLKVILVILIVILLILSVLTIIKLRKLQKATFAINEFNIWINKIYEEQKRIAEEKEKNKFKQLNQDEINKVESIYKKDDIKKVYLTFDDGPSSSVTPYILDLLKQENIKVTFFVLGTKVEVNPDIVKRAYEDGHFIGNHGYSHKYNEIYENPQSVLDEYNYANEIIKNSIGNPNYNSLIFRFPGGSIGGKYNEIKKQAKELLKQNGIANLDWNALTNDSAGANTKEKIMENFYNTIQNKSNIVLLMHDASDKILTYECLPDIIKYLRDNNYEFKNMYDVINR